ncbi:MAG: hypothetical protein ABI718_16570 [Acidobacteriota bacterium]
MSPTASERIAGSRRFGPALWAGLALVTVTSLATLPASLWEYDELLFAQGVVRFEPLRDHPAAPGYPLAIAAGKITNRVFPGPFTALVAVSVLSTIIAFLAFALLFSEVLRSEQFGVAAVLLLYFSPVLLVHENLALSDNLALAFFALTFLLANHSSFAGTILLGLAAAATVGTRPQLCIAVLPLMLVALSRMGGWQERGASLLAFTAGCLAWLIPLVDAARGPANWWRWETHQAGYFAAHDAATSRGGRTLVQVLGRFVAHPWGVKWAAIPILILAVIGTVTIIRDGRWRRALPLIVATIPYLMFAVAMMDPADGPRYAMPSLPLVAVLAAAGLEAIAAVPRMRYAGLLLIVAYIPASLVYVSTILRERTHSPSPPAQAARWADGHIPAQTVILYDLALRPHADYLFRPFRAMSVAEGLRRYAGRADVPLTILADGGSNDATAQVFHWEWSDAYGKLTRNHYRVVSLIPLPPERRFVPLDGVYPLERSAQGEEWRWLGPRARIILPDVDAGLARMRFALSLETPFERNAVTIFVDGQRAARLDVTKVHGGSILLPLPAGSHLLLLASEKSFVPTENSTVARDVRRLAVQLAGIEQLPAVTND